MAKPVADAVLSNRFNITSAPTFEARLSGTAPIKFTRLTNPCIEPGRTAAPLPENAFSIQVPLVDIGFSDLKYGNKAAPLPRRQVAGQIFLFDLSARPTIGMNSAFDLIRFYISQSTIDELAHERGMKQVGGLIQASLGEHDSILYRMAQALGHSLEVPERVSNLFVEHAALAFLEHILHRYGGAQASSRPSEARLAPWQVRRVTDFIEENLENNPSISALAELCELSPSHFAQAFRHMMGMAPHRWLLRRRVERAKALLKGTTVALAIISTSCGFFDQSHFCRVFTRFEGVSPREWRRLNRV